MKAARLHLENARELSAHSGSVQQVGGEDVELKRVQLSIPAGHDLSGLTFVIRSADSTAWWRDGECAIIRSLIWPCHSRG